MKTFILSTIYAPWFDPVYKIRSGGLAGPLSGRWSYSSAPAFSHLWVHAKGAKERIEAAKMVYEFDQLSHLVIGTAVRVHSKFGPGLFESVYHKVVLRDLLSRGLHVESKKPISFEFDGLCFKHGFIPDLIVERSLVVELKSVKTLTPLFEKQLLTYLRLLNCKVGLLINFNTLSLRSGGIKRIVNNF
jgi:GxxExxY protein